MTLYEKTPPAVLLNYAAGKGNIGERKQGKRANNSVQILLVWYKTVHTYTNMTHLSV
jgi:hypothetical protein